MAKDLDLTLKKLTDQMIRIANLPKGMPFCQNAACKNQFIYSPNEIRAFGSREQKVSGKKVKIYQCLICKKRFTLKPAHECISRKTRNDVVLSDMVENWTGYQSLDDLYLKYRSHGVTKKGLIELKNEMVKKVNFSLPSFAPGLVEYSNLSVREVVVTYKKNHSASVFFIFKNTGIRVDSVWVTSTDERERLKFVNILLQCYVGKKPMKIEGPHQYPNTQSVLAVHENADILDEYFKKLMFQKWTVVRDLKGLFVQMSLFRHALNNRYEKDHAPAVTRLRSRLQAGIDKRQKSPKENK